MAERKARPLTVRHGLNEITRAQWRPRNISDTVLFLILPHWGLGTCNVKLLMQRHFLSNTVPVAQKKAYMDSILALWCQNVSIFPVLIIFLWIKERIELQRVWFLKVVLKRLGFLHSEWTSGERYFIYSTTVSNVISFLPWRHAQIQNWWNLTNKIYLESCEGGGATGKPCLSKNN